MSVPSSIFFIYFLCLLILHSSSNFHDHKQEKEILVIYSSAVDYNFRGVVTTNETIEFGTEKLILKFYDVGYTECSFQSTSALEALMVTNAFDTWRSKEVVGVVGPSCSESAYAVAQLIKRSGVSVRHFHTSPLPAPLAAEVSGTSVGLLPPVDFLADTSVALIKDANWSRIIALYQDTDTDLNYIFNRFQKLLESGSHKNYGTTQHKNTLVFISPLKKDLGRILRSHASRVFFLMLGAGRAWDVLCNAYNLKILPPTFQWVIVKTTMEDILSVNKMNCKRPEIFKVLKYAIFINFNPGMTGIGDLRHKACLVYERSIWALLDNMNSTIQFNLCDSFSDTSKASIYGFSKEVFVKQVRDNGSVISQIYSYAASFVNVTQADLVFVPSEPILKLNVIIFPLGIFFIVSNTFFLLVYAVLLSMTIFYRKHPSMRKHSPLLLYLSYAGIVMVNWTIYVYFVQKTIMIASDSTYVNLCWVYHFMNNAGVTLVLGTVALKVWRLYRIFVHYMNPGKLLSDHKLVGLVCCLPLVDIITCIFWFVFDPLYRAYSELSHDNLKATVTYQARCRSRASPLLIPLLTMYKICIVLVVMLLTFKLRSKIPKVHKRLLSTALTVASYVFLYGSIFSVPGYAVLHFLLRNMLLEVIMFGILFSLLQLFCVMLIFVPPLLSILNKGGPKYIIDNTI